MRGILLGVVAAGILTVGAIGVVAQTPDATVIKESEIEQNEPHLVDAANDPELQRLARDINETQRACAASAEAWANCPVDELRVMRAELEKQMERYAAK
ncbi:MAG TPA: hypothetical protein VEO00_07935 [Actinomycetota bacterium]|nr:hypothetical protein [Actinomycetota bacterium]